jgi:hypothetical protein
VVNKFLTLLSGLHSKTGTERNTTAHVSHWPEASAHKAEGLPALKWDERIMETGGELVVIAAGSAMVKKGKDSLCKISRNFEQDEALASAKKGSLQDQIPVRRDQLKILEGMKAKIVKMMMIMMMTSRKRCPLLYSWFPPAKGLQYCYEKMVDAAGSQLASSSESMMLLKRIIQGYQPNSAYRKPLSAPQEDKISQQEWVRGLSKISINGMWKILKEARYRDWEEQVMGLKDMWQKQAMSIFHTPSPASIRHSYQASFILHLSFVRDM